jgi:transketolase
MSTFGESAPAKDLYAHFGITADRVAQEVKRVLGMTGSVAAARAGAGA